jgi:hypothetical protein
MPFDKRKLAKLEAAVAAESTAVDVPWFQLPEAGEWFKPSQNLWEDVVDLSGEELERKIASLERGEAVMRGPGEENPRRWWFALAKSGEVDDSQA